jgi:hypothetical protein
MGLERDVVFFFFGGSRRACTEEVSSFCSRDRLGSLTLGDHREDLASYYPQG